MRFCGVVQGIDAPQQRFFARFEIRQPEGEVKALSLRIFGAPLPENKKTSARLVVVRVSLRVHPSRFELETF
jgi:hypothetical protein